MASKKQGNRQDNGLARCFYLLLTPTNGWIAGFGDGMPSGGRSSFIVCVLPSSHGSSSLLKGCP